eukprot:m51a1_g14683 putative transmembrane and tpr repeat-containing protein 3 (505) ;mRNA; f:81143-83236
MYSPKGLARHLAALALPLALVSVIYSNALDNSFCFDDRYAIVRNPDVSPASPLSDLLSHDFWGQDVSQPDSHKSYRPVTVLSFRLNRLLLSAAPGETPDSMAPAFHRANVALHALACAAVYAVALACSGGDAWAATAASALFAVHPVHVEAVTGVVGRADLLCVLFSAAAYLLYARCARPDGTRVCLLLLSAACVVAAALCKETGLTMAAVLVAHDVLLVPSRLRSVWELPKGRSLRHLALRTSALAATVVAFSAVRKWILVSFTLSNYRRIENPIAYTTGWQLVMNLGMLHTTYARLLFFPTSLCCDYSFNCIPLVESLLDWRNLTTALVVVCVGAAILYGLVFLDKCRKYFFPVAWALISFLPSSNIFFFVGTMVAERLLYVPSVGSCILLGMVLSALFMRNYDWHDDAALFKSAEAVCSTSSKVQYILGQQALDNKDWDAALSRFRKTLAIEPNYCEAHQPMGIAYIRKGELEKGIDLMTQGIDCKYTLATSVESLHTIYR